MWAYLVRRLVQALFILFIITMLCFILTRLSSDPMSQYANRPGHDAGGSGSHQAEPGPGPAHAGAIRQMARAGRAGQPGQLPSSRSNRCLLMIQQRLPLTLILMFTAEVFIIIVSLILGLVAADQAIFVHRQPDHVIFLHRLLHADLLHRLRLHRDLRCAVQGLGTALPADRRRYLEFQGPRGSWPATWSCRSSAWWRSRPPATRATCVPASWKSLDMDYVRTARAKGLSTRTVLFKHALRNAILPFVTIVGLGHSLPAGRRTGDRIGLRLAGHGAPVLGICPARRLPGGAGRALLITSTAVVFFTIIVDLIYTVVDPRIRLS